MTVSIESSAGEKNFLWVKENWVKEIFIYIRTILQITSSEVLTKEAMRGKIITVKRWFIIFMGGPEKDWWIWGNNRFVDVFIKQDLFRDLRNWSMDPAKQYGNSRSLFHCI
jgi:hypothetical protein